MRYLITILMAILLLGCNDQNNTTVPEKKSCQDQCSDTGTQYCHNNTVRRCVRSADGCFVVEDIQECQTDQVCHNGSCFNSNCTDECYQPDTITCHSDTTRLLCGNFDDDICFEEIKHPCGAGLNCVDGLCVDLINCGGTCHPWEHCESGTCTLREHACNTASDCDSPLICDTDSHTCRYPANLCQGVNCSGHGTCYVSQNQPVCICDEGYQEIGTSCISTENPCETITCSGHGTCIPNNGHPYCQCDTYYHPEQWQCISDVDQCDGSCGEWEWCIDQTCQLKEERCDKDEDCSTDHFCHIATHTCRPDDPCSVANCFTNSSCVARDGMGWCQCIEGYEGIYCDQCAPGYYKSGNSCTPCEEGCTPGARKCEEDRVMGCVVPGENLCPEWQPEKTCQGDQFQICTTIDQKVDCYCQPGYHQENGVCISGCELNCGEFGLCAGGTETLHCQCIDEPATTNRNTIHHYGTLCEFQCEQQCTPGEQSCDPDTPDQLRVCQTDQNGCHYWEKQPFCNNNRDHLEQCVELDGNFSCSCYSGYERCGDLCYNTLFNRTHCGGCDVATCSGIDKCIDGICQWGCQNDPFEPNNLPETAKPLGGGTYSATSCVNNTDYDLDYYAINIQKGVIRIAITYDYLADPILGDQHMVVDLITYNGTQEEIILQNDLNQGYIYIEYHINDERQYYLKTKQATGKTIQYQILSEQIEQIDQDRPDDRCFLEDLAIERGNVQAIRDGDHYFYRLCEDIHHIGVPTLSGPQNLNRGTCGAGTTDVVSQNGCIGATCDDDPWEGGEEVVSPLWNNKVIELKDLSICSGSSDLFYISLNPNTSYHLEVSSDEAAPPLHIALYDLLEDNQNRVIIDYSAVLRGTLDHYYSEMGDQKKQMIFFRTPGTITGKILKIYPLYGDQISYDLTILEGD